MCKSVLYKKTTTSRIQNDNRKGGEKKIKNGISAAGRKVFFSAKNKNR
jgi:hypothetical protein